MVWGRQIVSASGRGGGLRGRHVEFARDLRSYFSRWCGASGTDTFDGLCDLLVQFWKSVPVRIATYVSEHKVRSVAEAAVRAGSNVGFLNT